MYNLLYRIMLNLNKTGRFPLRCFGHARRMYCRDERIVNRSALSEQEYFYKQQRDQMKKITDLKEGKIGEKAYHEKMIEKIEKELQRHKENLKKLKKLARMSSATGSGLTKGAMDKTLTNPRKMYLQVLRANEEEYFNRQQNEKYQILEELIYNKINKTTFHEKTIAELEKQVNRHKEFLKKLRE